MFKFIETLSSCCIAEIISYSEGPLKIERNNDLSFEFITIIQWYALNDLYPSNCRLNNIQNSALPSFMFRVLEQKIKTSSPTQRAAFNTIIVFAFVK